MIKQHLHFNIPDEIDRTLWRYVDFNKLKKLLNDESLYFRRSDLFEDDHEGSYTAGAKEFRKKFYEHATDNWISNTVPSLNQFWRQCTFISCWHVNDNENIHMWKSYTNLSKSIAIKTKISKLKKYILDKASAFLLGPINYIDYNLDLISEANAFAPFFYKRKEFESEREFRIITEKVADIEKIMKGELEMPEGINIKIDIPQLVDGIYVSPFSDVSFEKEVINLLDKYKIGTKFKISSLKRKPEF